MTPRRWLLGGGVALFLLLVGWGMIAFSRQAKTTAGNPSKPENSVETASARTLFAQAERLRVEGSLLEAKKLYAQVLQQPASGEIATNAQERLGQVSLQLLLSPAVTPDSEAYVVQSGDTLSKIAKQFHTTVELIQLSNGLRSDRIRLSQRLKVTKASFSLIVDKSQNTLTLKQGEEVLKVYRCSTGKGGITPVGTFRVVSRIVDPPWYSPEGVIPYGDPRNILGSRWLGFDLAGYGIHGTTDPSSIGKQVTQGCVRLANADVEELFAILPEGAPVTILE